MEILLTILGWLAWCVVAYLAITFVYGTRIYAKSGIPLNSITCVQTFLWWAIALTFLFSNLSKLHIIWLVPISFLGARFIVLTGLPPIVAQIILLLTQIFMPIILLGVRVSGGGSEHGENTHYQSRGVALTSDSTQDNPSENRRDVQAYRASGNAHLRKLEQDLAIADYTKAIEIAPEFVSAYCDRGHAYTEKGEYDFAIADWTKVIETDPSWVGGYYYRGQAYTRKGEYERAITDFTKVIEMDPSWVGGFYYRGQVYTHKGEFASAYCERGRAYRCKAKYELAIADYTKAIEIAPEFVSAYCDRGHAYTEKGEYDLAIADWTKVIETDPSWVGGYYYRGQAYTKKSEYERAILDYTKVIEIQPSTVLGQAAHYNLGCIYLKMGDTDSALERYDALKRLDENAANELHGLLQEHLTIQRNC